MAASVGTDEQLSVSQEIMTHVYRLSTKASLTAKDWAFLECYWLRLKRTFLNEPPILTKSNFRNAISNLARLVEDARESCNAAPDARDGLME